MNKLALNFICKDEEHVIERMLNSSNGILDLIVAVDTGSTDKTIDLIKKFGIDNNIPTYVFERPFDTFDKCRNFAMDKLRETVKELNWDSDRVYGMWYDCDEQLMIEPGFDKNQFTNDLYMINTFIGQMKYTRNTFFKVSKPFRWYGVVHEFIVCDDQNISSGLATDIAVNVSMDGASWKNSIHVKYLSHSHKLETYIANNRQDPRWIFYTAQSYHDSASMPDNQEENKERLRRSLKYYKERTERTDGYVEEIYYAHYRMASIMKTLEEPWNLTMQQCLKAYAVDPLRGESIKLIIDYYLQMGEWNLAYLYTKFGYENFHNKNPYPTRLLFVEESLYNWKFAEAHAAACFYTNRKSDAQNAYNEILKSIKNNPGGFTQEDLNKININARFFK